MFCLNWHKNFHILHDTPIEIILVIIVLLQKISILPTWQVIVSFEHPSTENSSPGSYFHFKTFAFWSPSSPLGFSNDPIGLVWMFSRTIQYSLAVYTLYDEQTLLKNNIEIVWKIIMWTDHVHVNSRTLSTSNSLFK